MTPIITGWIAWCAALGTLITFAVTRSGFIALLFWLLVAAVLILGIFALRANVWSRIGVWIGKRVRLHQEGSAPSDLPEAPSHSIDPQPLSDGRFLIRLVSPLGSGQPLGWDCRISDPTITDSWIAHVRRDLIRQRSEEAGGGDVALYFPDDFDGLPAIVPSGWLRLVWRWTTFNRGTAERSGSQVKAEKQFFLPRSAYRSMLPRTDWVASHQINHESIILEIRSNGEQLSHIFCQVEGPISDSETVFGSRNLDETKQERSASLEFVKDFSPEIDKSDLKSGPYIATWYVLKYGLEPPLVIGTDRFQVLENGSFR